MKIAVHSIEGKETGRSVELPEDIFGIEPNEHTVYLAVKAYLAAQRQGTHKAKEKGEISFSTKKIKRQKGTGTARAGSLKNPLFRKGGRVFGPRPRTYGIKLNKKVKRLARKSAFSDKAANGGILIVEDFTLEAPKTNAFVNILTQLGVQNEKTLVVTSDADQMIQKSARNYPRTQVRRASDLNTYEVVNAGKLVLTEGAIAKIQETFA